eukprot:scaffold582_cov385-Prasinococcus_capsulatus_cf.AAC.25
MIQSETEMRAALASIREAHEQALEQEKQTRNTWSSVSAFEERLLKHLSQAHAQATAHLSSSGHRSTGAMQECRPATPDSEPSAVQDSCQDALDSTEGRPEQEQASTETGPPAKLTEDIARLKESNRTLEAQLVSLQQELEEASLKVESKGNQVEELSSYIVALKRQHADDLAQYSRNESPFDKDESIQEFPEYPGQEETDRADHPNAAAALADKDMRIVELLSQLDAINARHELELANLETKQEQATDALRRELVQESERHREAIVHEHDKKHRRLIEKQEQDLQEQTALASQAKEIAAELQDQLEELATNAQIEKGQLMQKLRNLQTENDLRVSELEERFRKSENLANRAEASEAQLLAARAQAVQLAEQLSEKSEQINRLNAQLLAHAHASKSESSHESPSNDVRDLRAQNEHLEERVRTESESYNALIDSLRQDLISERERNSAAETKIEELEAKVSDVESHLALAAAKNATLLNEIELRHEEHVANEELQDTASANASKFQQLTEKLECTEDKLKVALEELNHLKSTQLEDGMEVISRQQMEDLRMQLRTRAAEADALRSTLAEKHAATEAEVISLQEAMAREQKRNAQLQEELGVTKELRSSLESLIEEEQSCFHTEKQRLEQAYEQLELELQARERTSAEQHNLQVTKMREEIQVHSARADELQMQLLISDRKALEVQQQNGARDEVVTDLEKQIGRLEGQLADAQKVIYEHQQADGGHNRVQTLEDQVEILKQELADAERRAAVSASYEAHDVHAIQKQLTAANKRAEDAETSLVEFQGKYAELLVAFTDATAK